MRRLGFLAPVLAGCIVMSACSRNSGSQSALEQPFASLIPANTTTIARIQFDQVKETELYKGHEKQLALPMLEESPERLGFDPRKDVSELVMAYDGTKPVFLVGGRFKPEEVEVKLASLGAQLSTYKKLRVIGNGENATVFLSKSTAVLGPEQSVRGEIDLHDKGTAAVPEELAERVRAIPRGAQVWLVSRGFPAIPVGMRSDVSSALSNIVNFISGSTAAISIDSGFHLQLDITCISEQGGKRVHDALRGAIGFGRLTTRDDQGDLLRIYDAIDVRQDKQLVHVTASYSGELTDNLLQAISPKSPASTR